MIYKGRVNNKVQSEFALAFASNLFQAGNFYAILSDIVVRFSDNTIEFSHIKL